MNKLTKEAGQFAERQGIRVFEVEQLEPEPAEEGKSES